MNVTWVGSSPPCLVDSPTHDRVVFTLGNFKYSHLVPGWSARLNSFGWHNQLFVALDATAANASRRAATSLCTVAYYGEHQPIPSSARERLPPSVGMAKFSMMLHLLRQGHGAVVLTEMDVFWFRDPWPIIGPGLKANKFVAQDNYPWTPNEANIGFLAASPHNLTFHLFENVIDDWIGHCAFTKYMNRTIQIAADQKILNDVLHHQTKWFTRTLGVKHIRFVLDKFEFPSLNLQERGEWQPKMTAVRKLPSGLNVWFDPAPKTKPPHPLTKFWARWQPAVASIRPHAHLKDSLRVMHMTGVREELKMRLLDLLFYKEDHRNESLEVVASAPKRTDPPRPNLALGHVLTFCGATWGDIVAQSKRLEGARHGAIARGDLHVVPNFLSGSELALLRQHLVSSGPRSAMKLAEVRNNYAHDKRLLDFGSAKGKLEPALVKLVTGAFARAHSLTRKLSFQSDVYEASNPEIGFSQHISWHGVGSDFPPHVDFAPNCVAILIYLTTSGEGGDFTGGTLQTRGCPELSQCPTVRAEYSLNTSHDLACTIVAEHSPRAGELVAFLAETAHAVTRVTSGTRVALNSWLNCPWKRRTAPEPWSRARHEATISACAAFGAGQGASNESALSPPPQPPPSPPMPPTPPPTSPPVVWATRLP